jgi:hypothetical protein
MVRTAVPVGRVAMARENDLGVQFGSAENGCVEIANLKPQEHAIARREVWVADRPVMMGHIPAVQLKNQATVRIEPLIMRPAVPALTAKESLIPATARLDITHTDKGLRVHRHSAA